MINEEINESNVYGAVNRFLNRFVASDDVQEKRLAACRSCEHYNKALLICNICKCFINVKIKVKNQECPDTPPKW